MVKVKITKTTPVAVDGIHIRKFTAGEEKEVTEEVKDILLSCGACQIIRERLVPESDNNVSPSENSVDIKPAESKEEESKEEESMRVYQLSDELNISSVKIVNIAKKIGIKVKTAASGLTADEVSKIKSEFEKSK